MALYDWMRAQPVPQDELPHETASDNRPEQRSKLETTLACAGIAVWLLSAYEMLLTALK